ncbi:hypothetical protein BLOT_009833 [Blomia tropicalis]|nr:hypothetical protein BLOT_015650 [Blomia tropicalis]KAI2796647.1 hypothetical protein BLOT_015657 [Blomia tropicalis]KAI2802386.1 hypothetical protein BLOT_009833 [Blomia tropicalis]
MSIQDMENLLNDTHISISFKIEISTENSSSNIKEINIEKEDYIDYEELDWENMIISFEPSSNIEPI